MTGDTIVAVCTAPGFGQRAVVRLSGQRAHSLAAEVLDISVPASPGRVGAARLGLDGEVGVPLTLIYAWAPRSLTGEHIAELHLRAWPSVVTLLVRRLVEAGARPAARGEFARRALALGKLDLAQVSALGRLGLAQSAEEAVRAATGLVDSPSAQAQDLRAALLDTVALVEAHVDFEEEDTEAVEMGRVEAALQRLEWLAMGLARHGIRGPARDGETDVVLLGPPNAGKSLLFTALCPGARTTVSPQPGTTRDALEAQVVRAGRRFRVLDGPGVDESLPKLDHLDRRAMQRFLATLPPAAVVLLVEDAACQSSPASRAARRAAVGARPVVDVFNKVDLLDGEQARALPGLAVSALEHTGLDPLWEAVCAAAPAPRAPDVATAGELQAAELIRPLLADLAGDGPAERLASLPELSLGLSEALDLLESEADERGDRTEEVLDRIFASFCIGK